MLCKDGPAGTTATFTIASNGGGTLLLGSQLTLDANPAADGSGCVEGWRATDPAIVAWVVTITETGSSTGTVLQGIKVLDDLGTVTYSPPVSSAVATVNYYHGAVATVNYYHGAVVTFTNVAVTPPAVCIGLTPGYWKNWRNHYTAAQFTQLLQGTIAPTISDADALFAAKGRDATTKLRWFVLANQLTLNLTGTSLPNPSSGSLTSASTLVSGGSPLGDALATGLNILNGVGGPYSESFIDAVKSTLDAFANLE